MKTYKGLLLAGLFVGILGTGSYLFRAGETKKEERLCPAKFLVHRERADVFGTYPEALSATVNISHLDAETLEYLKRTSGKVVRVWVEIEPALLAAETP